MKPLWLGLVLSVAMVPVWGQTVSPKLQHLIQGFVAASEEIGKATDHRSLSTHQVQAQQVLLKVAAEGIHSQENKEALSLVPGGSWLFFVASMAEVSTPPEFCQHYDEDCRASIAADRVPWSEDEDEAERVQKEADFEKRWQALGFKKIRFTP